MRTLAVSATAVPLPRVAARLGWSYEQVDGTRFFFTRAKRTPQGHRAVEEADVLAYFVHVDATTPSGDRRWKRASAELRARWAASAHKERDGTGAAGTTDG